MTVVTIKKRGHGNMNALKPQSVLAARNGTQPTQDSRFLKGDAWDPLPGSNPVPLDQRTGCNWPLGAAHPFLFCDLPITKGVYCEAHNILSVPDRSTR